MSSVKGVSEFAVIDEAFILGLQSLFFGTQALGRIHRPPPALLQGGSPQTLGEGQFHAFWADGLFGSHLYLAQCPNKELGGKRAIEKKGERRGGGGGTQEEHEKTMSHQSDNAPKKVGAHSSSILSDLQSTRSQTTSVPPSPISAQWVFGKLMQGFLLTEHIYCIFIVGIMFSNILF